MPSPRSVKDIQRLAGRMVALSRFISRLIDKCLPFFKLFKNFTKFVWDDQCEKAFIDLKTYLSSSPLLVSLEIGERLYLYLVAFEKTFIIVLVKETPKGQFSVYHFSKVFHNSKFSYNQIKKLAYSFNGIP